MPLSFRSLRFFRGLVVIGALILSGFVPSPVLDIGVLSVPTAPTGLSASPLSQTEMTLTWTDNAVDEENYRMERSLDGTTGWTEIAVLSANTSTYLDSGLTCSSRYYYRVRASNVDGNSGYSNKTNNMTRVCSPNPPSEPGTVTISQTQIDLNWTDNSTNEQGFKVERSPDGIDSWSQIAAVGANAVTYSNTGLTCGSTYYYRIRAYNAGGDSAYTDPVQGVTVICSPAAPGGLSASSISMTELALTWVDNAENESGYKVERSLDGTTGWNEIADLPQDSIAYSDTSLSCGTRYYYRVRAYNAGGYSGYSNKVNNMTRACIPTPPSNMNTTTISQTQIDLGWTDNSTNEQGFKVERSPDGVDNWTQIAVAGANAVAYSNTGLTCGSTWYYRTRAYNASGDSAYTDPAQGLTVICNPTAPTGLSAAVISQTELNLTWTDNAVNESGYKVERSLDGTTDWTEIADLPADTTTYPDAILSCGTRYYYRVRAYNAGGYSGYSNKTNNSTKICTPAAPTGLSALGISQGQIDLSWTDNSDNEQGFKIERSLDGINDWTQIIATGANTIAYSNTGLTCNTTYYYRVRSYNAGGDSVYTDVASAATGLCLPAAPTSLTVTQRAQTQIDLGWMDNADNEIGYILEQSQNAVDWIEAATLPLDSAAYARSGLTCGTTYYFRVRAYNDGGYSAYSNRVTTSTLSCVPLAPGNLQAVPTSLSAISLSWLDNSYNEEGFQIYRSPTGTSNWTQIAVVAMDSVSYQDTDLICNTPYYYMMRSYNSYGNSAYTSVSSAVTYPCLPASPSNLRATDITTVSIRLDWDDHSLNEEGFRVERSLTGVSAWQEIASLMPDVTTFSDGDLTCDTIYYYRVQAYNQGGSSAYSNKLQVRTAFCPLGTPLNLSAQVQPDGNILLTWLDQSSLESGFEIEISLDGITNWVSAGTTPENIESFVVTNLRPHKTYWFRVRAFSDTGASAYSNIVYEVVTIGYYGFLPYIVR